MGRADAPLDARVSRHRELLTALAVCLGVSGVVLAGSWAGWPAVADALGDVHPGWLVAVVVPAPVALGGYTVAYRATVAVEEHGLRLGWRRAAHIVTAGFGAFAVAGGFRMDQHVLCGLGASARAARRLVLGLGALEYGVLAPAAWLAAVVLLADGAAGVQSALLWSWALAVPAGFVIGLWLAAPRRRERIHPTSRARSAVRDALEAVGLLLVIGRHPVRHAGAWAGMALYWAAEITMLYAAGRLFGVTLGAAHVVLAYATGYALTRRSMPLGGAGATELLMALSLHWVGLPLATTVPIVVAYRAANFLLPAVPAIRSHVHLGPLAAGRRALSRPPAPSPAARPPRAQRSAGR